MLKEQKKEEFAELRQELAEEDSSPQEEIFAKSNLEEPKTQAEEALESYRYKILEKQGRQIERQNRNFLYTAASFFLVIVCVIGITTINNYRKMQEVEDVLHVMKNADSEEKTGREEGLVVESVSSQVEPLEEKTSQSNQDNPQPEQNSQKRDNQGQDNPEANNTPQNNQGEQDNSQTSQAGNQPGETPNETGDNAQETSGGQQEPRYYTVKAGDTLASICLNVYHSKDMMKKVCEVNGIENGDKIYVGQKLLLP